MQNKFIRFLYTKRVFFGFLFGFSYLIFSFPADETALVLGIFIAIVGESIRLFASGYIIKNDELATYGPYSFVRHPLYLGSFIMGFGLCLSLFSYEYYLHALIFMLAFLTLFFSVYIPVLKAEEAGLIEKFKDEYLDYKNNVPMLFPTLNFKKYPSKIQKKFDLKVFKNNKEFRALIGLIFVIIVLIIKYNF